MKMSRDDIMAAVSKSVDVGLETYPINSRVYQADYIALMANHIKNGLLRCTMSEPVRRNEIIKLAAACVRYLEEGFE